MYLHLGEETTVLKRNLVAIFDLENTTVRGATRRYLERAAALQRVIYVGMEMPKSFIICIEQGEERVYISQISAATLRKRAKRLY